MIILLSKNMISKVSSFSAILISDAHHSYETIIIYTYYSYIYVHVYNTRNELSS